ncbi:hypothetical protein [Bradyrhizobium sp. USDA 4353]
MLALKFWLEPDHPSRRREQLVLEEKKFACTIKVIAAFSSLIRKIPLSFFRITCFDTRIPSHRRGVARDRHDTRGGERWPRSCRSVGVARADERHDVDVKSQRAGTPMLVLRS